MEPRAAIKKNRTGDRRRRLGYKILFLKFILAWYHGFSYRSIFWQRINYMHSFVVVFSLVVDVLSCTGGRTRVKVTLWLIMQIVWTSECACFETCWRDLCGYFFAGAVTLVHTHGTMALGRNALYLRSPWADHIYLRQKLAGWCIDPYLSVCFWL